MITLLSEIPFALIISILLDIVLFASFCIYHKPRRHDQDRIEHLESLLDHERQKRHDDRIGRTRAERLLREQQLITCSNGISSRPIGFIRSVFRDRRGTPRQSLLASHARAELILEPFVQAQSSLSGLDDFSHLWLVAVFHENTDSIKALQGQFKAKVAPPRLNGVKKGIFATRSPHRPNPIALSLGRILQISGNRIVLGGVDLIDGTPILDIKPYVGRYDALPDAACPEWIRSDQAQGTTPFRVQYGELIADRLSGLVESLEFYDDIGSIRALIDEVLQNDIRSLHQRISSPDPNAIYIVRLDRLLIRYSLQDDHHIIVRNIVYDSPVPAS